MGNDEHGRTGGRLGAIRRYPVTSVHLLTAASLRQVGQAHGRPVDPVRLRPNLLLDTPGDGSVEDAWVGCEVAIGSAVVLAIRLRMPRCVVVDLPQPGVTVEGRLLQTVTTLNDSCLGVVADVVRGGTIRLGDVATLVGQPRPGQPLVPDTGMAEHRWGVPILQGWR